MTNRLQFPQLLTSFRKDAGLTNTALASLAKVPASLIAGAQSGNRRVGEIQASRISAALDLSDDQAEAFILAAIDTCTDKLLDSCAAYPASVLNLLPLFLLRSGITADGIRDYAIHDLPKGGKMVDMLTDEGRFNLRLTLDK